MPKKSTTKDKMGQKKKKKPQGLFDLLKTLKERKKKLERSSTSYRNQTKRKK